MKTIRVSIDKTFPGVDSNVKLILEDAISSKSKPRVKTVYNSKMFKVIHISGIDDKDVDKLIDDMFTHGYPARVTR